MDRVLVILFSLISISYCLMGNINSVCQKGVRYNDYIYIAPNVSVRSTNYMSVDYCCDGYVNISNICTPINETCIHGNYDKYYNCKCDDYYVGIDCDILDCPDGYYNEELCEQKCENNTYGNNCQYNCTCNDCHHVTGFCNECNNNGYIESNQCVCRDNYGGSNCSQFTYCDSMEKWNATLNMCIKRCVFGYSLFNFCICLPGYTGILCDTITYNKKNVDNDCDCIEENTIDCINNQCICKVNYNGNNCENKINIIQYERYSTIPYYIPLVIDIIFIIIILILISFIGYKYCLKNKNYTQLNHI
ncbi:tenascin [Alphaentomopoxvirus acuprea]|uniref:Tenascin n=1 Tax=Alphaentomopoxvirus acuprea TaxID=62099 RepID=W6JIT5_9POXV|nr:tenascin [Anomala cuprea entomopoxvirus]BAO49483.1 tenascin [Anomala cuprea entomopoxvirus]